ncbi:MAG: MBL fold metallo-hydrolase [bacterium]|nr:MBL fold metallo-hydrolase [bacterium]
MKKNTFVFAGVVVLVVVIYFFGMNNNKVSVPEVTPVEHASFVLNWKGRVIYVDPVDKEKFAGQPEPDIILITDIHGDHLDPMALKVLAKAETIIVIPRAASFRMPAELMPQVLMMDNGETKKVLDFNIQAIPMYNLPESPGAFHVKGRGNGYVVENGGGRIYISGDTSGTPEMRGLKDIDIAFVAMNLPYTMSVEEAAGAVLEFAPKKVYPYHYRISEGFSDVAKFKQLIDEGEKDIEVVALEWY